MLEAAAPAPEEKPGEQVDATTYAIVMNWRAAVLDLAETFHVDLHDPAVLSRPWPPIRDYILSLLVSDSRLRAALTRR